MELLGFNTIGSTKTTLRRYNLRERIDELSKWLGERTGQPQDEIVMNMDQCEDLFRKIETQLRRTLEWNSDNCFLNSTMAEIEVITHEQADALITSAANTKRAILSDYGIITQKTLALVSQTRDIQCELHKAQNEIRMRNGENYVKHYQGLHLLTAEILLGKFNHHPWTTQNRLNSLRTYLSNNGEKSEFIPDGSLTEGDRLLRVLRWVTSPGERKVCKVTSPDESQLFLG
jgi:hypothetical protein